MPRRTAESGPSKHDNGFDRDEIERYLDAIDAADNNLLALKSDHMNACKGPRGRIRDAMAIAKEGGVNMVAFRAFVSKHRGERKVAAKLAELEADDRADFDALCDALGDYGDTPLGEAAKASHKGRPANLDI